MGNSIDYHQLKEPSLTGICPLAMWAPERFRLYRPDFQLYFDGSNLQLTNNPATFNFGTEPPVGFWLGYKYFSYCGRVITNDPNYYIYPDPPAPITENCTVTQFQYHRRCFASDYHQISGDIDDYHFEIKTTVPCWSWIYEVFPFSGAILEIDTPDYQLRLKLNDAKEVVQASLDSRYFYRDGYRVRPVTTEDFLVRPRQN